MHLVIVNPAAGRGRVRRALPLLRQRLQQLHIPHDLAMTEGPGHASRLAKEAVQNGYTSVVAVGGDGTVNEVVNGLVGTTATLGLIPLGTGNDLARTLGIPRHLEGALQVLSQGCVRTIDYGQDTRRAFTALASLGFAADVAELVNRGESFFHGSAAFFTGVLLAISRLKSFPVRLELDGKEVFAEEASGVFILNTRFTGGGLMIAPQAVPDDGLLDIAVIGRIGRLDLLATLPRVYWGGHTTHPALSFYRARHVRVHVEQPMPRLFDGEINGIGSLDVTVQPIGLRVIAPLGPGSHPNSPQE